MWAAHLSPLPLTLLVSVIPFIPVLTIASEALCVLVTLIELEIRGRVWRRAIPMFGSVLKVTDTLMSIGV